MDQNHKNQTNPNEQNQPNQTHVQTPEQNNIAQPSEKPKSKINLLKVILMVTIVVILTLIGVFFVLNSHIRSQELKPNKPVTKTQEPNTTPDPTANWKTFSSRVMLTNMTDDQTKESNLPDSYASFKYPKTWDAKETGYGTYNSLTLTSKNGTEISYSSGGNFHGGACSDNPVTIYNVYPLDNGVSLVEYKDSYLSKERMQHMVLLNVVDGTFKVGEISDCKFDPVLDINKLQIVFGADKLVQADKQEAIKILSTFKFTQKNADTLWKLYEGPDFSFAYPPDYNIYINQVYAFERGLVASPNTIELMSGDSKIAYQIKYKILATSTTLNQFIDSKQNDFQCVSISSKTGEKITIGGEEARIYYNVDCGVWTCV